MPTYEYKCEGCGYTFEKFQPMRDKPIIKCPKCGGGVRRLISSGVGVIFKGSGISWFFKIGKTTGDKDNRTLSLHTTHTTNLAKLSCGV